MSDLTAEVGRTAGTFGRQPSASRLLNVLVADAPPAAEELQARDDRLPGWACVAIVTGLAASTWAIIIFAVAALF